LGGVILLRFAKKADRIGRNNLSKADPKGAADDYDIYPAGKMFSEKSDIEKRSSEPAEECGDHDLVFSSDNRTFAITLAHGYVAAGCCLDRAKRLVEDGRAGRF
jgi:hypothetical protein